MILLLGIEIFSIIPEEQVSLIFWVIRHLDAFYSSELPWLSGHNEKDNSNFAEGAVKNWSPTSNQKRIGLRALLGISGEPGVRELGVGRP